LEIYRETMFQPEIDHVLDIFVTKLWCKTVASTGRSLFDSTLCLCRSMVDASILSMCRRSEVEMALCECRFRRHLERGGPNNDTE